MIDTETARVLENIPPNLKARGWKFVRQESHPYPSSNPREYHAVYVRRYEPSVDNERLANPTQDGWICVDTSQSQSPSWTDAYDHAVQRMEFLDNLRTPQEST